MATANNPISHHTSHTMGNGASSSSCCGIHGDASHPIGHHTSHTMENGAGSSNNGAHGDGATSCVNGHNQGDVLDAPLMSPATDFFNWNMEHNEADQGPLTDVSPCSSVSRDIDDSDVGTTTSDATPMSSVVNLANFSIIDSTLREGEQFITAYFNIAQKIRIAQGLDDFGVDYIELTSPAASEQSRADCEAICKLGLRAKVLCHIRCNMDDARIAVQTGVDGINMCIGTSSQLMKHSHGKDMAYISAKAQEVIEYVKSKNIEIRFSGEDSFRSDFSEILKLYSLVDRLGADRVGIADTVGGATPIEVYDKIDALRKAVSCDIETHFHNDTGCAIANAFVALEAGATHIDTTVLGIGERNGITPLGGLMACLIPTDRKFALSKYRLEKLNYLEKLVAQIVGVEIPFNNFTLSLKDME
ncbi:Homocitrate synthase, mitochondrial [Tolypocladium capitatum]|uniref:Homocitrate synthase, mitochondrial n=1 Tax=Tolypocladium capitatum TaxID=45235 RepID=A0A2K3Q3U8_9HYPO|nr:Homocitrate synthase, mitochondrial [Tolypocladium capitatum]